MQPFKPAPGRTQAINVCRIVTKEAKLIDATLKGDSDAFGVLVRCHQDRLFASMFQITRSREEAEDVVQEAFVRAYVKLHTFEQNSRFFTWLYRIAFNSALSRSRKKRACVSLEQTYEVAGNEPIDLVGAPDEGILRNERVILVRKAIGLLSKEHRTILVLREMEECSYGEIADILSLSIGTVRSRLSRARSQLHLILESMQSL